MNYPASICCDITNEATIRPQLWFRSIDLYIMIVASDAFMFCGIGQGRWLLVNNGSRKDMLQ